MLRKIVVYTDGAARGNPGPSASGFMIYDLKTLLKKYEEYNNNATNNYAEYKAILLAIKWCVSNLDAANISLELYSDNELAIRQLNDEYKIKSAALKPMRDEIKKLIKGFGSVEFKNVRRENIHIKAVDKALNVLLDATDAEENQQKSL